MDHDNTPELHGLSSSVSLLREPSRVPRRKPDSAQKKLYLSGFERHHLSTELAVSVSVRPPTDGGHDVQSIYRRDPHLNGRFGCCLASRSLALRSTLSSLFCGRRRDHVSLLGLLLGGKQGLRCRFSQGRFMGFRYLTFTLRGVGSNEALFAWCEIR